MKKIVLISIAALLASCGGKTNRYDATGTFEADCITVSAQTSGTLLSLSIEEGDTLSANQIVAIIDTTTYALQARQLQATSDALAQQMPNAALQLAALQQQLRQAEQEQTRFEALVRDGAATQKQLDDIRAQEVTLRSQIEAQSSTLGNTAKSLASQRQATDIQREQALLNVERCHVASPIDGVVLQLFKHAGEQAAAGMPLFQVADVEHMTLHCYFTSEQLSRLAVGQQVTVFCDYGGSERYEYTGTLTWISTQAEFTPKSILTNSERANQVYAAKVSVKNDGKIKIGMYGGVNL